MITVNFTGGAKKWFNIAQLIIEKNDLTIKQLLKHLIEIKPNNTIDFDEKNLLIAVNGIDSSALHGFETRLKPNDVINIIPIIHGGSHKRINFKISNKNIELFHFKKLQNIDNNFLASLRTEFPDLLIQAVSSNFILNKEHIKKIISLSFLAKKHNMLLSKKLEMDILLRFAGTTQIADAINNLGIRKNHHFVLIAIGKKLSLNKLYQIISPDLINLFTNNHPTKLKIYFNISNNNIASINSRNPLEDLLIEKAAILI